MFSEAPEPPTAIHRHAGTTAVRALLSNREKRHRYSRLVPLLVAIAGIFDLACTLSAYQNGWLVEMNPLVAVILNRSGAPGLVVYRFALTVLGCVFLSWGLRAYHARRFTDTLREHTRIGAVLFGTQSIIVTSHIALVAWWIAWLTA